MQEVSIKLNGAEVSLRPTLKAAMTIDKSFGGMLKAFQAVTEMSFAAYAIVIAAGLEKKPSAVEEDIFATGLEDLVEPVAEFLSLLMNGGRKREDAKPGE